MKKLAILASLLVALPASADRIVGARLTGYQEVPSVSTQARGEFAARVDKDGQTVTYALEYQNMQGTVTQAHIHFAQRSVNGPIIIWLCGTASNPGPQNTQTCPQTGRVSGTFTSADVQASPTAQQLAAGELAEFISAMVSGVAYVNVHTTISPGGEIRGQVSR